MNALPKNSLPISAIIALMASHARNYDLPPRHQYVYFLVKEIPCLFFQHPLPNRQNPYFPAIDGRFILLIVSQ